MTRLLLAICLCLALAPTALANQGEAPADDPAACPAGLDDCNEPGGDEDGEQSEGEDDPEACEPDGEDGQEGEDGEQDADEPVGDDAGDELAGDDELGEPQAEAETALPAPGFRDFCEAPVFDRGFLRRKWRVGGDATGFSDGVLGVTVTSIPRVPARFREQAGRLEGLQLAVVVSRRTKLSRTRTARGARRRGSRRVSPGTLERARRVKVEGKLLPPSRWRRDAEGLRVPTVRASRVTVVR